MAANETPPFWFESPGVKSWLLWPIAAIYNRAAAMKMLASSSDSVDVPVLCVGNFVAGGGGKTPTSMALAHALKKRGFKPGFLSRGYGGRITTATVVDTKKYNALDVGDEPLLLAQLCTTVVSADRVAGAKLLIEQGCDFILMDDGFQNPSLEKDYNLVVVDSRRGVGNGFALPAGPLRVDIKTQLGKADSVLIVGKESGADTVIRQTARSGRPVFHANLMMHKPSQWKNKSILPYAGIADPQKFFDSLKKVGASIVQMKAFGDHHYYQADEAEELIDKAKLLGCELVTTAKDYVRLLGMGKSQQKLAELSLIVHVELRFDEVGTVNIIIDKALSNFTKRHLAEKKAST